MHLDNLQWKEEHKLQQHIAKFVISNMLKVPASGFELTFKNTDFFILPL